MRSRKGKIRLDIAKLEKKEEKDIRRLDMLQRQIGMTRNIKAMLKKSLEPKVVTAEEAWKPSEIPTLDSGPVSDIPSPDATPMEGK
jgi:hypothetical protein